MAARTVHPAVSRPASMLSFPDGLDVVWPTPPPPGRTTEVAPGVLWARLPLPFRLDHVNVWLLREDDGWTVIDTGCATPALFAAWEGLLAGPMQGLPVRRVVATHGHVDHIGLSGWLAARFGADFLGTFGEWMWARISHMHNVPGAAYAYQAFLKRHGLDEAEARLIVAARQGFIDLATPLPSAITELRDGQLVTLGRRVWRVVVTRGHAHEHAAFHDAQGGLLIAGDHLLPTISPLIAVFEMVPRGDPLGDYLRSFDQFAAIPDDTLVLSSHGLPYRGIHRRIAALREHHKDRLQATLNLLVEPRSVLALCRMLFPRAEDPVDRCFALGETLAHVNRLLRDDAVEELADARDRLTYQARPQAS